MATKDLSADVSLGESAPAVPKIGVNVTVACNTDSEGSDPTSQVSVVIIKEGGYDVEPEA